MITWVCGTVGLWDCGTVGLWDSCGRLNDPSLARQACVRGIRDDHLGRLMINWVGERFKPLLARRAIVLKKVMIIWVCGTVGLWDSDSECANSRAGPRNILPFCANHSRG